MTVWQWLTSTLPLEDEHDIMARIGFRFVWCTGPYFLLASVFSAFGVTAMLSPWLVVMIASVPLVGAVSDWIRLRHRPERAPGAAA